MVFPRKHSHHCPPSRPQDVRSERLRREPRKAAPAVLLPERFVSPPRPDCARGRPAMMTSHRGITQLFRNRTMTEDNEVIRLFRASQTLCAGLRAMTTRRCSAAEHQSRRQRCDRGICGPTPSRVNCSERMVRQATPPSTMPSRVCRGGVTLPGLYPVNKEQNPLERFRSRTRLSGRTETSSHTCGRSRRSHRGR